MIIYLCIADLRLPSSGSQSEMVKHVEFNHVLDTIFCGFWMEFVHRALSLILSQLIWFSLKSRLAINKFAEYLGPVMT